nr:6255_t:CDS:2 [Entrophospora candida]
MNYPAPFAKRLKSVSFSIPALMASHFLSASVWSLKLVKGTQERPRVVLSESNRYLRVQAIDDTLGNTLLYSSTADFTEKKDDYSRKNKDYAKKLGEIFADKLKKKGQKDIVFDRNARPYHGKIKDYPTPSLEKKNDEAGKGDRTENLSESNKRGKWRERKPEQSQLKSEILETSRPTKVTKGGRRFSFTCLVLVKDEGNKAVAYARSRGKEVMRAFRGAFRKAQGKLITYFPIPPRSIARDVVVKCKTIKLLLKPAQEGSGIKASDELRKLFTFLGIKDISAKIISSHGAQKNKLNKKRDFGRGIGSGRGKTCGRGGKGQTARTGGGTRPGFEGGQTPVFRRFPKHGFKTSKLFYQIVNLEKLEKDEKIVSGQTVDFLKNKVPTKILGKGKLTKKLIIKAIAFSQKAQEEIVRAGGKFETIQK